MGTVKGGMFCCEMCFHRDVCKYRTGMTKFKETVQKCYEESEVSNIANFKISCESFKDKYDTSITIRGKANR